MKRHIKQNDDNIQIEISDTDGNKKDMLNEFGKCQAGTCSCPTNEYSKLDSMDIEESEGKIKISLTVKDGENIDVAEIEKCLDHTEKRIKQSEE